MSNRNIRISRWISIIIAIFFSGLLFGWMIGTGRDGYVPDDAAGITGENFDVAMDAARTIAVVNLDSGILMDGVNTYFSQSMVSFPDDDFVMTGIEDARKGISSGKYATYIVIPASFSESVDSINESPSRITLDYQISPALDSRVKSEVVERIAHFSAGLNENITYTYISSIFKEFHAAQDNAKTVMENNKNDYERLSGVNPASLLDTAVIPERIFIELMPVDFDSAKEFYQVSVTVAENVRNDIDAAIDKGKNEYFKIKEGREGLEDETEYFLSVVEAVDILHEKDGNPVHGYGMEKLLEISGRYEEGESLRQETILAELENRAAANQAALDARLEEINAHSERRVNEEIARIRGELRGYLDLKLTDIQVENTEAVNTHLREIRTELEMVLGTPSNATPSEATPANASPSNASPSNATPTDRMRTDMISVLERIDEMLARGILRAVATTVNPDQENGLSLDLPLQLFAIEYPIREPVTLHQTDHDRRILTRIEELFEIPIEDIKNTVENDILDKMEGKWNSDSKMMRDDAKNLLQKAEDYMAVFEKFDPYAQVDSNISDTHMREAHNSIRETQRQLQDAIREQERQVRDFEHSANENVRNLEETIRNSNKNTETMIAEAFTSLLSEADKSRRENTGLLKDFSMQLSYSRNGNLPNKSTYKQISSPVAPIKITDTGKNTGTMNEERNDYPIQMIWVIAGSVLFCMATFIVERKKHGFVSGDEKKKAYVKGKSGKSAREV